LLDPKLYPAADLAALYLRRWHVELFLRHIKTTLKTGHADLPIPGHDLPGTDDALHWLQLSSAR